MAFSGLSRFLPSRRVGALVVVVASVIASTIILRAESTPSPHKVVARLTGEPTTFDEADTDQDGVKDWEEALRGFSPVDPDSDGDGVGDADEIREDKELFEQLPGNLFTQATENPGEITPLGLAGRALISQFLTAKQAGVPFTEDNVEVAAQLALAADQSERSYTTYTISDITVSAATDSTALRAYGNALGDALTNKSGTPAKHELSVLLSLSQTNDTAQFEKDMQDVLARYDMTINGFLNVTVPSSATALHLQILNAMARVRADLSDTAKIADNPIASVAALATYVQNSDAMALGFTQLRAFFKQQGIAFTESEPAYGFMYAALQTPQQN